MLERAAAVADSLPFLLPSPPLPSPLPFLFFSLHDVCRRLFHLANPPVPLHCHPISAPRESTLPPPLPPVHAFPRLFRDKGRQSGGEINTRRAGNEAGGEGGREGVNSPTFDDVLFFPISNTTLLSPSFFFSLTKDFVTIYEVFVVALFCRTPPLVASMNELLPSLLSF